MSALTIFQEFDKQKSVLASLSMPNKTSKAVIQKVESELRQALLKNRGSPENSIMSHIHEMAAKDDANDRIGTL
jgi:hypothetical protein